MFETAPPPPGPSSSSYGNGIKKLWNNMTEKYSSTKGNFHNSPAFSGGGGQKAFPYFYLPLNKPGTCGHLRKGLQISMDELKD